MKIALKTGRTSKISLHKEPSIEYPGKRLFQLVGDVSEDEQIDVGNRGSCGTLPLRFI